jgi:hypothetical protein
MNTLEQLIDASLFRIELRLDDYIAMQNKAPSTPPGHRLSHLWPTFVAFAVASLGVVI